MADATKFRSTIHHQSNELVALEWVIEPLNEQLDILHANIKQESPSIIFAKYQSIAGVLKMANLPCFSQLAHVIAQVANHDGCVFGWRHLIFCASKLLQYELNHYVLTGFLHETLVNLRIAYLQTNLPDVPKQDLSVVLATLFSDKITTEFDTLALPDFFATEQAWQDLYDDVAQMPLGQCQKALKNFQTQLLTLAVPHDTPIFAKLWKVSALWLADLSNNHQTDVDLVRYLLDGLHRAILLQKTHQHLDLDTMLSLDTLVADIYIALAGFANPSIDTKQLLECLDDDYLVEKALFVYVIAALQVVPDDLAKLHHIKNRLIGRGWLHYGHKIDELIQSTADTWQIKSHQLCTSLSTLQTLLDIKATAQPSILSQSYQALECAKRQFTRYLRSKDIRDLPTADELYRLSYAFDVIPLDDIAHVYQQLADIFVQLRIKAPKRISWQLAHKVADGLMLFEAFLDGLARQVFDHDVLEQAQQTIAQTIQMIETLADEVDEIFDIYARLLKAHESMVLYDDVGSHEPVVGEVLTSDVSPSACADDIEEASVTQELSDVIQPIVQTQQTFVAPPAITTLVNDNHNSQGIFLTDILSVPNLSLSQNTQINHDIQAATAYAMHGDDDKSFEDDEALIEDLLSKGLLDGNSNQPSPIVSNHLKTAEPLSVYQEFIEESNQVNDNHNIDTSSQIDPSNTNPHTVSQAYITIKEGLKDDDFGYDEEFREIFVEEADEVMQEMNEALPKWQADITDLDTLVQIRRNFHTLKGSGRMVGAFQIGETAWAIENLLNRVLDKAIDIRQEIADLVAQTAKAIPVMVQDFAKLQAPSVDNVKIILQANNILAHKPVDEGLPNGQSDEVGKTDKEVVTAQALPTKSDDVQTDIDSQIVLPEVLTPFIEQASRPLVSVFADADADIKAIFIEEADEILTQLIPQFVAWRQNRQQDKLTEIRCAFHALKGSARMVGAAELGELAWSIENLLNHIIDGSIELSQSMVVLMSDVLADFGRLVGLFEAGVAKYPEHMTLWMACANAYSQGHGDEFDYQSFSHFAKAGGMDWSLDVQTDSQADIQTAPPSMPCQSAEALGFIQEAKAIMLNATPTTPHDEEEEMLCQIFVEEGRELLAEVKAFLQEHQHKDAVAVNDKIVRAFHTLRGASGLSPLALVGEVGAVIERGLQSLQQHDAPMKATHLQALGNAVELIEAHLTAYEMDGDESSQENDEDFENDKHTLETLLCDSTQEQISDMGALIEGIDTLLDAELELETIMGQPKQQIVTYANRQLQEIELLTSRTSTLPKFQAVLTALLSAYQLIASHPDCVDGDNLMDALLATHHQLIGLFDSLAGSMSLKVDESVLQELSAQQTDYLNQALQTPLPVKSNKAVSKKVSLDELSAERITTDDELLEIFISQAQQVLVGIGQAITIWQNDLADTDQPKSLLCDLQTLSGGASLARVLSVSQLTDAMCMLLEHIQNQKISISDDWLAMLEQMYDILVLQIGSVQDNKQSFFVNDTIDDLQKHLSTNTLVAQTRLVTPVIETEIAELAPEFDDIEADEPLVSGGQEVIDFKKFIADSWHGNPPDKDILEVFLEEAKDLAESSSEDFAVFRNDTSDTQTLQSLQRKLHTIKGGARMVSANGVADLAHEMETIYEDLGNHRYPANASAVSLLFACHDWIVAAVNLLQSHYNPPRPTLLIDALHQFIQSPESVVTVPTVSLENEAQLLTRYHEIGDVPNPVRDIAHMPPTKGVFGEKVEQHTNAEMIRISAPLMEQMINLSGETAINRARIDMSVAGLTTSIEEMGVTVQRLADQLRRMDIELEAQILAQIDDTDKLDAGFDPLEMDQYSALNQLSKSLSESASDLLDIKTTLLDKTRNSESLLLQLSRTQTQLQDKLMGSRMVPFSRLTPRLHRIVRQTANELGKMVELTVINADGEVDRAILEHMTSPLEHMLRNAVDHGIEFAEQRSELGKSTMGHITLQVQREGNELVVVLSDDGAGINVGAVRQKIIKQGLIRADDNLSDNDVMQYIFNAGLSTANKVTQISGRGVGMDVVRTEIRQLGGAVSVESSIGKGSKFTIRVPLVVALSDVLIVRVADRQYAIPLVQIERVVQVETKQLLEYYQSDRTGMVFDGQEYRLRYLNEILANHEFNGETLDSVPVVIAKTQMGAFAIQADEIIGSRMEVVAKPLGNQLSRLSGISAATIMGDGSVMLILDLPALMRTPQRSKVKDNTPKLAQRHLIMVVDDSVTVRKVTSRFLERQGFDVVVAKDGVHAVEILQDTIPDLMLLDIEMPRMDGFEVATQVRHSQRLQNIPIIMITSRTGEKHRQRAFEIGVNAYLGKPFQEMQLLSHINSLLTSQPMGK